MTTWVWMRSVAPLGVLLAVGVTAASCAAGGEVDGEGIGAQPLALDEGEVCLVGEETLEHACLHALYGPFASVTAQAYPGFVYTDVNAPHTAYTIGLPAAGSDYQGAVLYQPAASGDFAFLLSEDTALAVYDGAGQPVAAEGVQSIDPAVCSAMSHVHVFHLEDTETYTVVLGPTGSASVQAVIEYMGEEGGCEACEHAHLVASKSYGPPPRWEDGVAVLDHPISFEIPGEIPVTEGNAGNRWVTLRFRLGGGPVVRCRYRGGADVPYPSTPEELEAASRYVFSHCNNGMVAGDDAEADQFRLRVLHGGNAFQGERTEVELELEDEACHGHEHEQSTP